MNDHKKTELRTLSINTVVKTAKFLNVLCRYLFNARRYKKRIRKIIGVLEKSHGIRELKRDRITDRKEMKRERREERYFEYSVYSREIFQKTN